MNKTAFYAKIITYNEENPNENEIEYAILYASSFSDATGQIEEYYRNDLLSFEIFGTDEALHKITAKEYEAIKNESI